jgi:hypothetical protein
MMANKTARPAYQYLALFSHLSLFSPKGDVLSSSPPDPEPVEPNITSPTPSVLLALSQKFPDEASLKFESLVLKDDMSIY